MGAGGGPPCPPHPELGRRNHCACVRRRGLRPGTGSGLIAVGGSWLRHGRAEPRVDRSLDRSSSARWEATRGRSSSRTARNRRSTCARLGDPTIPAAAMPKTAMGPDVDAAASAASALPRVGDGRMGRSSASSGARDPGWRQLLTWTDPSVRFSRVGDRLNCAGFDTGLVHLGAEQSAERPASTSQGPVTRRQLGLAALSATRASAVRLWAARW